MAAETEEHRFWRCPKNQDVEGFDPMALERLQQAGVPTPPCFLARGLLPKRALLKLDWTYYGTFWRGGAE
eukprot:13759267-Alexandrium_andersonii.AAC.1